MHFRRNITVNKNKKAVGNGRKSRNSGNNGGNVGVIKLRRKKKMSKTADFREEITAKIITALETGTAPWQQPWNGAEGPQNGITHRKYNGINTVILSLAMMTMDGEKKRDPRWFGYRQLVQQNNGAYVRKGER